MIVTIPPLSQSPTYDPNSGIDLVFQLEGFVVGPSIRFHGNYYAANAPNRSQNPLQGTGQAKSLMPQVGWHSLIASITTRYNQQQVEFINQYPHFVAQYNSTVESAADAQFSSKSLTEGTCGHNAAASAWQLVDADLGQKDIWRNKSFCIKPLNMLTSIPIIDCEKNNVTVTIRLNQIKNIICMQNGGDELGLMLSNLYLTYETISRETGMKQISAMPSLSIPIVQTQMLALNSNKSYLTLNLPMAGNVVGWLLTCVPQYDGTYGVADPYKTMLIPSLSRLRLTLNGRDVTSIFPYQAAGVEFDMLIEKMKSHRLLQLSGKLAKSHITSFGAVDRDFYRSLDGVYSDVYEPGLQFNNSSTLGFEIMCDVQGTDVSNYLLYVTLFSRIQL